jgi:hypothetical protein
MPDFMLLLHRPHGPVPARTRKDFAAVVQDYAG